MKSESAQTKNIMDTQGEWLVAQSTPLDEPLVYPLDQSEYVSLRAAIDKLMLNDSSVTVHHDSSMTPGQGWRVGFLALYSILSFHPSSISLKCVPWIWLV